MGEKLETAFSRGDFYPLAHTQLITPKGQRVRAPLHTSERGYKPCIATRLLFDALIQQHAIESGAEFRPCKVEKPLLDKGAVIGVKANCNGTLENIGARVVVGADGVNSVIERALRTQARHTDEHRALALRAYIKGIELYPGEVEFYLYREILPGYAWIFPMGDDRANLGLGMRLDHYRKNSLKLKKMVDEFLAMPGIANRLKPGWEISGVAAWPLNFGSQNNLQYSFDGALLAGDAAGFINPLTGGGISRSLVSGRLAAQVVSRSLQAGDTSRSVLGEYEALCRNSLLAGMRRLFYLQKLFLRYPSLVDLAATVFKNNSSVKRLIAKA